MKALCCWLVLRVAKSYIVVLKSKLIDIFSSKKVRPDYRILFKSCLVDQMVKHSKAPHSHYLAATDRCRGNLMIKTFSSMVGATLYSVSMSGSESKSTTGDHYYYNAKDLQCKSIVNVPLETDLLQMVDVDYYLELPKYMVGNNLVINTFVPNRASGNVTDGVFSIDSSNTLTMRINGGAIYQHELWDYETDHVMVDHWWGSCLYLVEQREIAEQKRLIFLNCVRVIYGPLGRFLPGYRMRRKKMVLGDMCHFHRLVGAGNETHLVHTISDINTFSSIEISDASLRTAHLRISNSKTPAISDVERILRANNETNPVYAAPLVYKLILSKEFLSNLTHFISPGFTAPDVDYQTLKPLVHEDGTSSVRVLMPPFCEGGYAPVRSYNNDNACVENRVKKVANRITSYTPFIWVCLDEFVGFLVPMDLANTLVPADYHYMETKFNRPSQRSLMKSVAHILYLDTPWIVRAFQKAEFYGKVTAPRNISTLPMDHNIRLGQYSYIFVEAILKSQQWYAFSKTPKEMECRIQDMCSNSNAIIPTDISKCDGSRGYIHYCLDMAVMMRSFSHIYHDEILRLLRKEAYAIGVTKFDLKYECDYNTLSGSSKTSWGNTITNAFNNYVALRYDNEPKQAWDKLGLFGGDDGLAIGVESKQLESTFARLGMLLKAEKRVVGQPVPFLGRIYLDPWTTPESIIDVSRQLKRIHATVTPAFVPDNVVVWRKIEGYSVNDLKTPIISNWCTIMKTLYPVPSNALLEKYHDITKLEIGWWARLGDNFTPLTNITLAKQVVADNLEITVTELDDFAKAIDDLKDLESISKITLSKDSKIEIDAVVGGLIKEGESKDHQTQVKSLTTKAKDPKVDIKRNNIPHFALPPEGNRKEKMAAEPLLTKKLGLCTFYAKNQTCPYGIKCKYEHPVMTIGPCRFFSRGEKCPYGKSCKFQHGAPKEQTANVSRAK